MQVVRRLIRRARVVATSRHLFENRLGASIGYELLQGAEAPLKFRLPCLTRIYTPKAIRDPAFRGTIPNLIKYLYERKDSGKVVLIRLIRKSY